MELGKLKRTLSEKCPNCNKPLQLRSRFQVSIDEEGQEIQKEELYLSCSNCEYEEQNGLKKRARKNRQNKWR
jgi:RNase P subunit RPR2